MELLFGRKQHLLLLCKREAGLKSVAVQLQLPAHCYPGGPGADLHKHRQRDFVGHSQGSNGAFSGEHFLQRGASRELREWPTLDSWCGVQWQSAPSWRPSVFLPHDWRRHGPSLRRLHHPELHVAESQVYQPFQAGACQRYWKLPRYRLNHLNFGLISTFAMSFNRMVNWGRFYPRVQDQLRNGP